jgi:hypothetical protein
MFAARGRWCKHLPGLHSLFLSGSSPAPLPALPGKPNPAVGRCRAYTHRLVGRRQPSPLDALAVVLDVLAAVGVLESGARDAVGEPSEADRLLLVADPPFSWPPRCRAAQLAFGNPHDRRSTAVPPRHDAEERVSRGARACFCLQARGFRLVWQAGRQTAAQPQSGNRGWPHECRSGEVCRAHA